MLSLTQRGLIKVSSITTYKSSTQDMSLFIIVDHEYTGAYCGMHPVVANCALEKSTKFILTCVLYDHKILSFLKM